MVIAKIIYRINEDSNMYKNKDLWNKMQDFLPVNNRLTRENLPDEYYYEMEDMSVHIDHYRVEKPKATMILFHGVGGNGRLLSFISIALQKQGYEVICPDLPLYGYTKYKKNISYTDWVDCGVKIVNHYHIDNTPIFVFGLSAGGMLAYQVACKYKVNGVIVTCLLDQRIPVVTQKTAINPLIAIISKPLLNLFHKPLAKIKLPMKAVGNMKAIVNNTELAKLLMSDTRSSGTKVTIEFLYSMLNPVIEIEPEKFDTCPLLLVHPENDKWTDVSLSRLFYDKLKCTKKIIMLSKAGHFPIEPEGCKQLENECIAFIETYGL